MKRLLLFLSLFMILATFAAFAETKPQQQKKTPENPAQEAPTAKSKFIIHLKAGGFIETSNYSYENSKIKMVISSGFMSLDRSMISRIEEIKNDDDAVDQNVIRPPVETRGAKPPVSRQPSATPAPYRAEPSVPVDDNGHSEAWWRSQVSIWKKKLADAQARFEKAQNDWNKYNGLVGTQPSTSTNPTATDFQTTQYQDLRGSSRVAMDQAQADMDEAKKMLEEGLPDEARKAAAPPGWAR